jgi:RNA polymerase sigma-70 factor (ECF subfamily)
MNYIDRCIVHDRAWFYNISIADSFELLQRSVSEMDVQANVPERQLVARAQAGNEEAFTELVRRHSGQVYGLSLNMLRNREDAEDNLQNVLVKAFHHIDRFEGNS